MSGTRRNAFDSDFEWTFRFVTRLHATRTRRETAIPCRPRRGILLRNPFNAQRDSYR